MEKRKEYLSLLFSVLLFGGLWGFMEVTLGTFLHLPLIETAGMFAKSTTIIVPLAFMIMGACYKRTHNFRSIFYMGLLAAGAKALVCAIFHLDFTPTYYILMEALAGGVAAIVIRPKEIVSFRGLGAFIFANTMYLLFAIVIRMNIFTSDYASIMKYIEKYVFTYNAIAILYVFGFGAILFGFIKLAQKYEWKFEGIKKVIYSPITAGVVTAAMIAVTFILR